MSSSGNDSAARVHRSGQRRVPSVLPVAAWMLAACGGSDSVTIRGDVAGLDTLALRGDSLVAEANRAPLVIDSLRLASQEALKRQLADSLAFFDASASRVASGSGDGTLSVPGSDGPAVAGGAAAAASAVGGTKGRMSVGGVMSRRAQARGDSMAKAFAARLTGAGAADRARADSVRGVLVWQGTQPTRTVVLRSPEGTLTLSGMATTGLGRLVGSEVVVRGVRVSPRDVVVAEYFVRAADGVPAFDGVILDDGSLRMSDGSGVKRVPLPGSMQGLVGARVWVAAKDGRPQAYGLIQTR